MSLSKILRHFIASRSGNFAMMAALSALPLATAIGCAADTAQFYNLTDVVQDAADAASLAAAKRMETGTADQAIQDAKIFAETRVAGQSVPVTFKTVIDEKTGTVTTTATGIYPPSFLQLINISSLAFERTSVTTIRQKGYMDFQFLLDVSESMNIAASASDREKLWKTTQRENGRKCAFACHEIEWGWSPKSIYQMNRDAPDEQRARLRIDVLREAADSMIDKVLAKNSDGDSLLDIRVQTNGFGYAFEKGEGPSKDAAKLKASIRRFSVANSHTNFSKALEGLAAQIGEQGAGDDPASIRKVALIITDGVKDENFSGYGLGPIDPTLCKKIKDKNVDLAVLEIKYVEDYDYQGYYAARVAPFYNRISPGMKSCATPGLYYVASDSADAQAKLLSLTDRLTTHKLSVAR